MESFINNSDIELFQNSREAQSLAFRRYRRGQQMGALSCKDDNKCNENESESEPEPENDNSAVSTSRPLYSFNSLIIMTVILMIFYMVINYINVKKVEQTALISKSPNNIILVVILGALYYFYNNKEYSKTPDPATKSKVSKNNFNSRLSNLPIVQDKNLAHSLMGDSIDDYLNYFKQFNKPLVKDIKKQLKYFEKIQREIMEAEINTFLVQELDNLNLVKKEILQLAESLIYSIDIANVKTENIYHDFNEKLKDTLNSEYYSTKEQAKNKKKINIQNCRADIDIFSGVLVSDQEILPSNH